MDQEKITAQLEKKRAELDRLDQELIRQFEQRIDIARQIGAIKEETGMPVLDAGREKEVLRSRVALLKDPTLEEDAEAFFKQLMQISRRAQEKQRKTNLSPQKVAFQGIAGSYGHQAAGLFFGSDAHLIPCAQFLDAMEALVSHNADYAVLPVENSIAGMVNQTLDILVHQRCFISGEIILPISHCLLAPEGAALEGIREVCSHQQALMQSSQFLAQHPLMATRMIENTAVSARYVAQQNDKQLAAIASRNCADLYGLAVLAEGIQDCAENFTRFVIVSRDGYSGTDWNKVSVRFSLPHKSGSLHEMLRIPAEEGVSLTSIVSRPYPGQSFQYYFYADIEADSTEQIEKALERMSDASRDWALLGRYASAERRTTWDASI